MADRGIGQVLEDDEDGPVEHFLELEGKLPPDDPPRRVGNLGQVQALRRPRPDRPFLNAAMKARNIA